MKTYARYFGALGFIFLIFGAISSLTLQGSLQWVGISQFICGLLGVFVFGFYHLGEALSTISKKREMIFGIAGGLLIFLFLIALNVIFHSQLGERKFDTTANKIHSLSKESANLLKNLKSKIAVIGFFQKGAQQKPFLEDLARKYTYESSSVEFKIIDPDVEPTELKAYESAPDEVLVRNETTKKSMKLTNITEEGLTMAIKKVMSEKTKVAYFIQGHGEGDLEDDKSTAGLLLAKILLENEGFNVKPLNLAATSSIPMDANVVAAWGAQRPLSKSEVDALTKYFQRGGNLIVGQNPILAATKDRLVPSGLESLLEVAGLEFKPSILIEIQVELFRGNVPSFRLPITDFAKHQLTNGLGNQAVAEIFLAQPVLQSSNFKNASITRTELAKSSKQTWAETDIGSIFVTKKLNNQNKTTGPLPVAQLAELNVGAEIKDSISKKGKLVVFGDANFGTIALVQASFNRDLFLNAFNYMVGEEVTLSIRPKTWTSSTLTIDDSQRLFIYFVCIFLIPEIIMGLGAMIWIFRRSRT